MPTDDSQSRSPSRLPGIGPGRGAAEWVSVVRLLPNGHIGPCPQRNEALRGCPSDWVFLLDSDAEPHPDCLARMLEALRRHPEASALTPRILRGRKGGIIHYDAGRAHFLGELCLENRDRSMDDAAPPGLWPQAAASTAMLLRREDALRAGLFDEGLVFFREDIEFCLRLRALGMRILHVPQALVHHDRAGDGSRSDPPSPLHALRFYYQTRNRWLVLLKILERRTLALTLPVQLLYEFLNLLLALRCGKLGQYLRAVSHVVRRLPEVLRERRRFQAIRIVPDRVLLGAPPLAWRAEVSSIAGAKMLKSCLDALCRLCWSFV